MALFRANVLKKEDSQMIFVGMDVHVRNSFLYATDGEGRRLAQGRRANRKEDLTGFCNQLLAAVGGLLQPMRVVL